MALLTIYEVPHPILKQKARPVEVVDDGVRKLVSDMAETMYAAPGVGLAAPQVGVPLRVLVADIPVDEAGRAEAQGRDESGRGKHLLALINPEVVEKKGETAYEEGCLSVPELYEPIPRAEEIVVRALSPDGQAITVTAKGFYAVVLQHEMDHLEGVTILDHVGKLKRSLYQSRRAKAKAKNAPPAEHRPGAI